MINVIKVQIHVFVVTWQNKFIRLQIILTYFESKLFYHEEFSCGLRIRKKNVIFIL